MTNYYKNYFLEETYRHPAASPMTSQLSRRPPHRLELRCRASPSLLQARSDLLLNIIYKYLIFVSSVSISTDNNMLSINYIPSFTNASKPIIGDGGDGALGVA